MRIAEEHAAAEAVAANPARGSLFVAEYFDWRPKRRSIFDRVGNMALRRIGVEPILATAEAFDRRITRLMRRLGGQRGSEPMAAISSGVTTNFERRVNMYHLLDQVLAFNVPGDVVEVGCYTGESSVILQTLICRHGQHRQLPLYDSFEGLPVPSEQDGSELPQWARDGGGLDASLDVVREGFRRYGLPVPALHKGWFKDTLSTQLPDQIAFAHLDGDLYESILTGLEQVYPRLSPGAICLIDDYCDPAVDPDGWNMLPGVKRACDEFFLGKPERIEPLYAGAASHAFFRKRA